MRGSFAMQGSRVSMLKAIRGIAYRQNVYERPSIRLFRNESAKPGRTILALVSGENVIENISIALLSHKNVTSGLTSDFAVDFRPANHNAICA